eukprot:TRINITY_DN4700_c0_g1_i1.p1 TRINITY_DN4700_c0_g1~~TRINITY_DN4700_c0_g1_i1.p1  ORF type:complete len:954 (+),score=81.81 TRINITY_DN4700_c0_g1_i1:237-3098(+)
MSSARKSALEAADSALMSSRTRPQGRPTNNTTASATTTPFLERPARKADGAETSRSCQDAEAPPLKRPRLQSGTAASKPSTRGESGPSDYPPSLREWTARCMKGTSPKTKDAVKDRIRKMIRELRETTSLHSVDWSSRPLITTPAGDSTADTSRRAAENVTDRHMPQTTSSSGGTTSERFVVRVSERKAPVRDRSVHAAAAGPKHSANESTPLSHTGPAPPSTRGVYGYGPTTATGEPTMVAPMQAPALGALSGGVAAPTLASAMHPLAGALVLPSPYAYPPPHLPASSLPTPAYGLPNAEHAVSSMGLSLGGGGPGQRAAHGLSSGDAASRVGMYGYQNAGRPNPDAAALGVAPYGSGDSRSAAAPSPVRDGAGFAVGSDMTSRTGPRPDTSPLESGELATGGIFGTQRMRRLRAAFSTPVSTTTAPCCLPTLPLPQPLWGSASTSEHEARRLVGRSTALEKAYVRSGGELDARDVRPLHVLRDAFIHVVQAAASKGKGEGLWWFRQLKGIRQDLAFQGIAHDPFVAAVYETHAAVALCFADAAEFSTCATVLRSLHAKGIVASPAAVPAYAAARIAYAAFQPNTDFRAADIALEAAFLAEMAADGASPLARGDDCGTAAPYANEDLPPSSMSSGGHNTKMKRQAWLVHGASREAVQAACTGAVQHRAVSDALRLVAAHTAGDLVTFRALIRKWEREGRSLMAPLAMAALPPNNSHKVESGDMAFVVAVVKLFARETRRRAYSMELRGHLGRSLLALPALLETLSLGLAGGRAAALEFLRVVRAVVVRPTGAGVAPQVVTVPVVGAAGTDLPDDDIRNTGPGSSDLSSGPSPHDMDAAADVASAGLSIDVNSSLVAFAAWEQSLRANSTAQPTGASPIEVSPPAPSGAGATSWSLEAPSSSRKAKPPKGSKDASSRGVLSDILPPEPASGRRLKAMHVDIGCWGDASWEEGD